MLPHDPEYVATMQEDDFDPHILMALTAKMITQDEFDQWKLGNKTANAKAARKNGKTTNYASVYNAGAAKIAQAAGVSAEEGKILHDAYWKLNWAVKAIAGEQVVIKDAKGNKWLVNPINGFCYALRKESDRFSTLAQGTGSFFFDMWVDAILGQMHQKYGKKTLTGSFHDENILVIRDTPKFRAEFAEIISSSIDIVNETYKLRRKLGCDTQYGQRYADIH
ncbi:DNA polymerase family A [compost metagenome]